MEIVLDRVYKKENYTIGKMFINGIYFCDTLEDKDRGLYSFMSEAELKKKKVYGKTAIPTGTYTVKMTYSTKFRKLMPLVDKVKAFDGIRIHAGNTADDSLGCILVGKNKAVGKVLESRDTFSKLYKKIENAWNKHEEITLRIK